MGDLSKELLATLSSAQLHQAMREFYPRAIAAAVALLQAFPKVTDIEPADLVHVAAKELLAHQSRGTLPSCNVEQFFLRTERNRLLDHLDKSKNLLNVFNALPDQTTDVHADRSEVQPERLRRWLKTAALLDGAPPIEDVVEALLAGILHKPDIASLCNCRTEDVENCIRRLKTAFRKLPDAGYLGVASASRSTP